MKKLPRKGIIYLYYFYTIVKTSSVEINDESLPQAARFVRGENLSYFGANYPQRFSLFALLCIWLEKGCVRCACMFSLP